MWELRHYVRTGYEEGAGNITRDRVTMHQDARTAIKEILADGAYQTISINSTAMLYSSTGSDEFYVLVEL